MKKRKLICAVLLIAMLCALLAGCGAGGDDAVELAEYPDGIDHSYSAGSGNELRLAVKRH